MKTFKLSLSIFKHNRLFSYALILIYTLVVSLLVMLCFFSESIDVTFQDFMQEYALPDGYLVTSLTTKDIKETMEKEAGVADICTSLTLDLNSELEDGTCYSLRYISMNEDTKLKLYDINKNEIVKYSSKLVAVSSAFARGNNLSEGSSIKVNDVTLTITNIISSPESIATSRNIMAWYELDSFAYVYVSQEVMEEISGTSELVNQFQIYFNDSVNQKDVLKRLENNESIEVLSSTLFEGSAVDKQIKAGIEGTKTAVSYLPLLIVLIGLLFSTLFVSEIILNSDNTISLLKVLGYSNFKVTSIFIVYSLLLTLLSSLLGSGLGYVFLKAMLSIYKNVYDLPTVIINGQGQVLLVIVLFIQLLGIFSCILCSSLIVRTDPMLVGKKNDINNKDVPIFIKRLGNNSFDKMVSTTIYRNRKRLSLSILCSIACFILSFTALSFLFSKNYGMDTLFKDRQAFDVTVYGDSEAIETVSNLAVIEIGESKIAFAIEYEDETMRLETLITDSSLSNIYDINYEPIHLTKGEIALEEGFARRHNLNIGDEVVIENCSFKVKNLVREYLYPVMYITESDAEIMGYKNNAIDIILNDNVSIKQFSKELSDIVGVDYYVNIHSRENNVRSTLKQLDTPCIFFVAFALITGLVIISNMNLLSIKERKREYATLLTLGVDRLRFFKMSLTEALIQYIFTCLFALPLSLPIASFLLTKMSSFSQEYVMEETLVVAIITMVLILIYLLVGILITNITVHKMNILEVLASKE